MPQIVKTPQTKIVTKNGETELSIIVEPIVIELTINVSADGVLSVGDSKAKIQNVEDEAEKVNGAIRSFGSQKIKFGKNA